MAKSSYDDLKNFIDKGSYEFAQALRALPESGYLAPEYQSNTMDERQTSFLEQAQGEIEIPQPEQQRQMEVEQ